VVFPSEFEGGRPVDSSETILIEFLPSLATHVPPSDIPEAKRILIKAVASESRTDYWRLFCEWRYGGTFIADDK
jgi:hypothetical protein